MKRSVKVCVRTRPTHNFAQDNIILDESENTVQITNKSDENEGGILNNKQNSFKFKVDHIFHNASQVSVYDMYARDTVQGVVDGISGAIMSYGQTGSGKSFTMIGDTHNYEHRGVAPRALSQLFLEVNARVEYEYKISCTYCELYGEKIYDLLTDLSVSHQNTDFIIAEEANGRGVFVRGLSEYEVTSENEALNLLFSGQLARTTAQHKLNRHSNRSHSIFTVHVQQRLKSGISEKVSHSKLHLVDLAGSERLKKTLDGEYVDEVTKRESMTINQSLTFLEQCVVALSRKGHTHVPYRQCKLTNILKDALGANCNTLVFACIWGEATHLEETVSTLRLASRMMKVQNQTSMVESIDSDALIKKQAKLIKALKQELLMHDALVERTGIAYEPYTPEQQSGIRQMLEKFIDAPEGVEEETLLSINSFRQVLEISKQFKKMILNSRNETRAARNEALGGFSSSNFERAASTGNDFASTSFAADSKSLELDKVNYVGAPDGSKKAGFILGVANADSVPVTGGIHLSDTKSSNFGPKKVSLQETKFESKSTGKTVDFARTSFEEGDSTQNKSLESFIRADGQVLFEILKNCKSDLKDFRSRARDCSLTINSSKSKIDVLQADVESKKQSRIQSLKNSGFKATDADEIIDEDEFILMKELKEEKRTYKNSFEQLQKLKVSVTKSQGETDEARDAFSDAFSRWSGAKGTSANGEMESTRPEEFEMTDTDQLDDQEAFERLEVDRVMSKDPDSLAFFHAQKTRRNNLTQNGSNIRQLHKNKRLG